ncbi:sigma-70 family rna polymerase sigma factor : RNA polymerase sigma factor, sigma-70 family OS=Singulisphaera acidiphila (strain ATCC BAA-1392 / DSM 18658 / VKM B-2454 / MOB10) GN=Sinac_0185 PE=4 SV=1: Sigma70_r2: Sigma70_r4_2 [Gemmata massiliana]|uniref:ECF RNA polymerase sigma factor SigE n=1 Tax=Gemmata massiliana TaxID=1210884 RepID=A0A6P2D043_9BACT|nr:RNA polymerase sigma factor [Gemmata massiliana]VTR94509.1 sigma-70 family rna polymerase sigma factor : RNA polymerase sigma factor, sigma-70 family OS=Singulisphaera acidiphila (strain ATCC BAA-1392 / DSM 18658 / VKM B-2454 / MOB10) GN=Sinac_0185 PE=4 SV=1: Sigma70_r2: Sigma70_r4_2 [Gemmata massiliana]
MPRIEPALLAAHIKQAAALDLRTDSELLERFAGDRDTGAFESLVWRHGPMVWATCRRVLRHLCDAEDAFQATFLALTRAAGTIGTRQAVAGWLHRVATNAALKLKAQRRTIGPVPDVSTRPEARNQELAEVVDEELSRLPDRMRIAFVLCCLEGLTSVEAARELGCPTGTVDSRVHTARTRLRERLTRRGFGPDALTGLVFVAVPPGTSVAAVLAAPNVPIRDAVDVLAREVIKTVSNGVITVKTVSVACALVLAGSLWAFGGSENHPTPTATSQPGLATQPVAPVPPNDTSAARRPRQPGGVFRDWLGEYLTIEGTLYEGGKVEAGTLLVDTVNGKKLDKPVSIVTRSPNFPEKILDLPSKKRCVLKGYEMGEMIGTPPAVITAAKEQGRDVGESQAVWQWRPYFVVLIVDEPKAQASPKP